MVAGGKASPGATTAAIALTLTWPREVLLVDADPLGGDVVPGLLPGRVTADIGLAHWATATRRDPAQTALTRVVEHVVALPEAPGAWIMPGVQSPKQMGAVTTAWTRLAQSLVMAGDLLGRDVIVDAGRLGQTSCWPLAEVAEVTLLAVRPTARSVTAAANAVELVTRKIGDTDSTRLLVTGPGPYTAAQVAEVLAVPAAGALPGDVKAAAALTDGEVVGIGGLRRSRLLRATAGLARDLASAAAAPTPTTSPSSSSSSSSAAGSMTPQGAHS